MKIPGYLERYDVRKKKFKMNVQKYPDNGLLYYRCPDPECGKIHRLPLSEQQSQIILTGLIDSGQPYCIYSIGSGGDQQGLSWHSFIERGIEQEKECHFLFIEDMRRLQEDEPEEMKGKR